MLSPKELMSDTLRKGRKLNKHSNGKRRASFSFLIVISILNMLIFDQNKSRRIFLTLCK